MKILIEEEEYITRDIVEWVDGIQQIDLHKEKMKIMFVGYFYHPQKKDFVYFLPKNVLDKNKYVLGHEEITAQKLFECGTEMLEDDEQTFIKKLPIWIYRVLNRYARENPKTSILVRRTAVRVDLSPQQKEVTLLDIILSIEKFCQDNRSLLKFIYADHQQGFSKINWKKTIARCRPIIKKDKAPYYYEPYTKAKEIDRKEELFAIFFSMVKYINSQYGTSIPTSDFVELYSEDEFKSLISGRGKQILAKIRNLYFSDREKMMWALCNAFFRYQEKVSSSSMVEDCLLAYKFDRVFEAMIDDLVGDRKFETLKQQDDNKIIDHLFKYKSLTQENKEVFYIGDSKYYETEHDLKGSSSEYKEYTYAKNIIQRNVNFELMSEDDRKREKHDMYCERCRDSLTEGYDITPNFFISSIVRPEPEHLAFSHREPILRYKEPYSSKQYNNRLFDRDTLFVFYFDIDFPAVVYMYACNNKGEKKRFKEDFRNKVYTSAQDYLFANYTFYELSLRDKHHTLVYAVSMIFKTIIGKVYRVDSNSNTLLLAIEKGKKHDSENEEVMRTVKTYFEEKKLDRNALWQKI